MVQTESAIGQNAQVVEPGEDPLQVMQGIDHLSEGELGFVIQDGLSDKLMYFKSAGDGIWLQYHPENEFVDATWADDLDKHFELYNGGRSNIAVIPVRAMPHWGDGTFSPSSFFD